jgi:hypothetical protein
VSATFSRIRKSENRRVSGFPAPTASGKRGKVRIPDPPK